MIRFDVNCLIAALFNMKLGHGRRGGDGGSLTHLESDDGMVKIEGEEGLRQLAEERLQDDCRDVHVPILEHDLLAIVDFALEGNRRICTVPPSN